MHKNGMTHNMSIVFCGEFFYFKTQKKSIMANFKNQLETGLSLLHLNISGSSEVVETLI